MTRILALRFRGIERMGIRFDYKGDELIFLWEGCWLSIGFDACFDNLKALDKMWDDYYEAVREAR